MVSRFFVTRLVALPVLFVFVFYKTVSSYPLFVYIQAVQVETANQRTTHIHHPVSDIVQ